MKKFISLVLALVMALSLTTAAWGAVAATDAAKIGDTGYATLADAVTAATAGDEIVLLKDVADGVGIVINKKLTIDFGGYTYTFASNPVGSTGTESQGFQILDSAVAVTLKNGTLTSTAGSGVKMLINNYCDLTLDGMTLIGTNLDDPAGGKYVLSNNAGNVVIEDTTITAAADGVAFDSYDYSAGGYTTPPTVTVKGTSVVTGEVVSDGGALVVEAGTFNGEITVTDAADVTVKGGTFTDDVSDYVADGSSAVVSGGKLVVSVGNTGSTNSYDDDDVTIIAKDGSKVAIADGAKVVMTQESKKTVNGKFASLVPAHFTYNGVKYVVCHEASATHVVTVKGVKYYTCAFNGVVPSVEKDGGVLYTAPKKATCGKVGVNEDKYVVIDNVYYLLSDSGTNYALVGGKMVVYSNTTGTMQEHVYDAVKSELKYNTDRTVATFKCAVCNNTIPVVAKKPNFATNYTAITLGNEGTYYYVSNTTGTTVSGGTTTGGTVNSADTFDAGIAMYVGMSVMAAAGSAVVIGKKKD